VQHSEIVFDGLFALMAFPKTPSQPGTGPHIGTGFENTPEITDILGEGLLPSARSPASTPLRYSSQASSS
jgi:hypothetical protein